jgi:hypothetical protein
MRITLVTSLVAALAAVLIASGIAPAQSAPVARDQVAAASRRAIESLRAQIGQEPIGRGFTVDDLLKKTSSSKEFMKTIDRAQQIGGPRWIDAQTCQVRLEIDGPVVARRLVEIATLDHLESPIPPEVLQFNLRNWDNRTFSATGSSACSSAAMDVRPDEGTGWAEVSRAARRQAVSSARQDAADKVLATISPVPLGPKQTIGDALKVAPVAQDVRQWIEARPITQVQFMPDRRVGVTLAVPADGLLQALRDSVGRHKALGSIDPSAWSAAGEQFASLIGSGGVLGAAQAGAARVSQSAVTLPDIPPDWAQKQIEAVGIVHSGHGLLAARAAEADADEKLRGQVRRLQLQPTMTLAQAADQDKEIADAIDRGIGHARTTRTEYPPAGGAQVTTSLDLNDVWQELQSGH